MFTKSQDSSFGDRILKRSGGKKPSEAGRSDCSFNVFHTEIHVSLLKH